MGPEGAGIEGVKNNEEKKKIGDRVDSLLQAAVAVTKKTKTPRYTFAVVQGSLYFYFPFYLSFLFIAVMTGYVRLRSALPTLNHVPLTTIQLKFRQSP